MISAQFKKEQAAFHEPGVNAQPSTINSPWTSCRRHGWVPAAGAGTPRRRGRYSFTCVYVSDSVFSPSRTLSKLRAKVRVFQPFI